MKFDLDTLLIFQILLAIVVDQSLGFLGLESAAPDEE